MIFSSHSIAMEIHLSLVSSKVERIVKLWFIFSLKFCIQNRNSEIKQFSRKINIFQFFFSFVFVYFVYIKRENSIFVKAHITDFNVIATLLSARNTLQWKWIFKFKEFLVFRVFCLFFFYFIFFLQFPHIEHKSKSLEFTAVHKIYFLN